MKPRTWPFIRLGYGHSRRSLFPFKAESFGTFERGFEYDSWSGSAEHDPFILVRLGVRVRLPHSLDYFLALYRPGLSKVLLQRVGINDWFARVGQLRKHRSITQTHEPNKENEFQSTIRYLCFLFLSASLSAPFPVYGPAAYPASVLGSRFTVS